MKELTEYNSDKILKDPSTKEVRNRYFKIYEDYTLNHLTEKQLAEKYEYSPEYICRVIKWVVFQLGEIDTDSELKTIIDSNRVRQQEIEFAIQEAKSITDKVQLWQELRRIDTFVAKLRGLLSNSLIDNSDRRKIVIVTDNLQRRTGTNE